jgi:hypothetical protein
VTRLGYQIGQMFQTRWWRWWWTVAIDAVVSSFEAWPEPDTAAWSGAPPLGVVVPVCDECWVFCPPDVEAEELPPDEDSGAPPVLCGADWVAELGGFSPAPPLPGVAAWADPAASARPIAVPRRMCFARLICLFPMPDGRIRRFNSYP